MAKKAPKTELQLGDAPGVGRVVIAELDEKAKKYKNFRNRRQDLTEKEVESKDDLTEAMHKYEAQLGRDDKGAIYYVFEDEDSPTGRSVVEVKPTDEQTKVRSFKDPGDPDETGE